ncbi:carbohydrate porin [Vulcanococcus sp.]|uniref:carbohydrate porin n=1 Tax=Vulcanococcus sp. TaxID=2856995 RepID=UPI003231D10C
MIQQKLIRDGLPLLLALLCGSSGAGTRAWASEQPLLPEPKQPRSLQRALKLPDWLKLEIAYTAEPMTNPVGGIAQSSAWIQEGSINLSASSGHQKPEQSWQEFDHWRVNLNLNHLAGDASYASRIGAFLNLQTLSYPSGFYPTELSVERKAGSGWLQVKAGVIPLESDFEGALMTAPIFNSYVHSALNDTYNVLIDALPINPYSTLAAVVDLKASPELTLRYGWYDLGSLDSVSATLGTPVTMIPAGLGSLQVLQLDYSPAALSRGAPANSSLPPGLISLGGYGSSANGNGVYGSVTWRSGLALGLDDRLWIGGNYSPSVQLNPSPSFLGGGLVVQGLFPKRPLDLLVLGGGHAGLSSQAPPSYPTKPYEGLIELGYRLQLNPNLNLQPTLQWIFNPSGSQTPTPGILSTSLQISLNL